jgi:hypothetical protein
VSLDFVVVDAVVDGTTHVEHTNIVFSDFSMLLSIDSPATIDGVRACCGGV